MTSLVVYRWLLGLHLEVGGTFLVIFGGLPEGLPEGVYYWDSSLRSGLGMTRSDLILV